MTQIAYALHGGGDPGTGKPPLLLIHGAGGSRLTWPPQLRRMAGQRIYAVDLPGHGSSAGAGHRSVRGYLQALLAWTEQTKEQQFIWAGHSLGGAIALQAALEAPQQVGALILVSTAAHLPVNPRILDMAADPASVRKLVDLIVSWSCSAASSERLKELSRLRMAETRPEVLHQDFVASNAFDVRSRMHEITQPALVVCGLDDRMVPEAMSRELANTIEGARLEFVLDAGHMLPLEQPEQLAQAIGRFLDSVEL